MKRQCKACSLKWTTKDFRKGKGKCPEGKSGGVDQDGTSSRALEARYLRPMRLAPQGCAKPTLGMFVDRWTLGHLVYIRVDPAPPTFINAFDYGIEVCQIL